MTIDHRAIPGIEWVSSPGPLRVGDYWRADAHSPVWEVLDDEVGSRTLQQFRVIPHVRPLEVPEETTIASLDELEVCYLTSGHSDFEWLVSSDAVLWPLGVVSAKGMEDPEEADVASAVQRVAQASEIDRGAR